MWLQREARRESKALTQAELGDSVLYILLPAQRKPSVCAPSLSSQGTVCWSFLLAQVSELFLLTLKVIVYGDQVIEACSRLRMGCNLQMDIVVPSAKYKD